MDFFHEVWAGVRPLALEASVTIVGALITILGSWLALRAAAAFEAVKDRELALSLYRTLENGLKAIIARRALEGGAVEAKEAAEIVSETVDFAKANNARAVRKLKQSDAALREKAMARLPEARAAILSAVQAAGRRGEGGASA